MQHLQDVNQNILIQPNHKANPIETKPNQTKPIQAKAAKHAAMGLHYLYDVHLKSSWFQCHSMVLVSFTLSYSNQPNQSKLNLTEPN